MCVICIHLFVITAVNVDGAHGVSRQPDEDSTGNKCPETEMPDTGKDDIMQTLKQLVDQPANNTGLPTRQQEEENLSRKQFSIPQDVTPPSHDKFF